MHFTNTLSRKDPPNYQRRNPRRSRKRVRKSRAHPATPSTTEHAQDVENAEDQVHNHALYAESSDTAHIAKDKETAGFAGAPTAATTTAASMLSRAFLVPQNAVELDDKDPADEPQDEEEESRAHLDKEATSAALVAMTNDLGDAALNLQARLAELTAMVIVPPGISVTNSGSRPTSEELSNSDRFKRLDAYKHTLSQYMYGRIEEQNFRPMLMCLMQINSGVREQHERILEAMGEFQRQKRVFKDSTGLELPLKYRDV